MRSLLPITLFVILTALSAKAEQDTTAGSYFHIAKQHLEAMLNGHEKMDYEEAIYEIENAWWEGGVDHDSYKTILDLHANNIMQLYETLKDSSSLQPTGKLLEDKKLKREEYEKALMNYAIYSYITKPGIILWPEKKLFKYKQFNYAYNDPLGTNDWRNTQVINLLNKQTGNCFALASLFKIFSERFNTDATLCTAPGHIYIVHKDNNGIKYNIELSNGSFPGVGTIETLTHSTTESVKNGIALRELDLKQSITLCLIYLAKGYEYKFGIHDDNFLDSCVNTALKYDDHNLNAMLFKSALLEGRLTQQHQTFKQLETKREFTEYQQWITHVYDMGYREMPANVKNMLLNGWQQDTIIHISKRLKNTRYIGLSNGLFDEEISTRRKEIFGHTEFDTQTRKITTFLKEDAVHNQYNFDLAIFGWSIDPMAQKFPNASPYNFVENNPISRVDPDGDDWILSTGNKIFWYGGQYGDKKNLLAVYKATSGMDKTIQTSTWPDGHKEYKIVDTRIAMYQDKSDVGPTPEGKYKINLKPDFDRVANANDKGDLVGSPEGGIEKIPDFVMNPDPKKKGWRWTYADWGKKRAHLDPVNVTGATSKQRNLNSFYFHDSEKGYSHGCTECETTLFDKLKEYKEAGNDQIEVMVKYPSPNHKTVGGTKKDTKTSS